MQDSFTRPLFQYLFAIAVILVHSGRLTSYEPVHFGLKSILGRLAVPFFIVCASFFLKQSLSNARKMKAYLVKIVKTYVFWSCVYLPYAWIFFSSLKLPVYLFPAGVLIALVYLGMCYQLWYIPAFLLGLFLVNQLVKHLGMIDHLAPLLLGLDRDLFGLSGHHESSKRLPAL